MTRFPAVRAVSYVLAHVPDLVRYGSKPSREMARDAGFEHALSAHLRGAAEARDYVANQVFIGSVDPEALRGRVRPWWTAEPAAPECEPSGVFLPQAASYGALRSADSFGLLLLERGFAAQADEALLTHGLWCDRDLSSLAAGVDRDELDRRIAHETALPIWMDGELIGCMQRGHEGDPALTAHVLLENLAAKATASAAVRHLLAASPAIAREDIDYVISAGEEAVGDRYQRGGGNLAKAIGEEAGLTNCTGSDVKAFCCGPVHAFVMASALVHAGVFRNVLVVGGGSAAKLGMKSPAHIKRAMPILEDVLAGFAVLVGPYDGESPVIRLDAIGKHDVRCGASAQAIAEALTVQPLNRIGKTLLDVDKYAVELHNPEVTEPAGGGDVPRNAYRLLASLAVRQGLIAREEIAGFEVSRGMIGFSPTQGHVASAVPYLGHARRRLVRREIDNAMFIAKGSLFLGRMTQMADGMSFVLDQP